MEERPLLVKPITGTSEVVVMDITTQQVTYKSLSVAKPFPKDYGIAFLSDYRTFILAGGVAPGTYVMLSSCQIIDIETVQSREVASLPLVLKALRLVNCNGEIYSIGGCTEGREHISPQSLCLAYSQKHDAWVQLADMPQAALFPGTLALSGEIWVTGGYLKTESGSTVLDAIQVYNVTRNQWRVLAQTLLRPSYLHACVSLPTGETLVCCGLRDSNSNRFSYLLGHEHRAVLPDKLSMCLIDPPAVYRDFVYCFNEDLNLLIYDWRSEVWTCFESAETLT